MKPSQLMFTGSFIALVFGKAKGTAGVIAHAAIVLGFIIGGCFLVTHGL